MKECRRGGEKMESFYMIARITSLVLAFAALVKGDIDLAFFNLLFSGQLGILAELNDIKQIKLTAKNVFICKDQHDSGKQ